MTICDDCGKEMTSIRTISCSYNSLIVDGVTYKRVPASSDARRCHDCNVINNKGNYHHLGCDMEQCPICGRQMIGCGCLDDDEENNYELTNT